MKPSYALCGRDSSLLKKRFDTGTELRIVEIGLDVGTGLRQIPLAKIPLFGIWIPAPFRWKRKFIWPVFYLEENSTSHAHSNEQPGYM